jgi:hypothetical protein
MSTGQPSLIQALIRWVLLVVALFGVASFAFARVDELPGRVGRVVQVDGGASVYDREQDRWVEALRNSALTAGDRLSTERGSRLQIAIGSTELRLAAESELIVDRLDDERMVLVLQQGSVAVRVRNVEVARELEVQVGPARARAAATGHFRFDRVGNTSRMTAWRGQLDVDTGDQRLSLATGRSVELYREWRDGTAVTWGPVAQDAFSDWVARDEQSDDRFVGNRYVSPEMTGADELDRYGRWDRHPELGWVWLPLQIGVDWAPFRHGRWTWHARWGWTWLDDAPWGFATSHYGRWAHWGGRWVWAPGAYVSRPVFAPALVGWVGGSSPGFGVSVSISSAPPVGWFPLSPYDPYVPSFRHPPRYYDRVNLPHRRPGVPPQVPTGPISYGNNGVPNAVTVVPAAVMQQRQPVAPAVLREREMRRSTERDLPSAGRVVAVPGGAVPVVPASPLPERMSPLPVPITVAPGAVQAPARPPVSAMPQVVMPQVVPAPAVVTPPPERPQMHVPRPEQLERARQASREISPPPALPVPAPAARPPMAPVAAPMAPVAAPMAPVRIEQPAPRMRTPEPVGRRDGREANESRGGMRERQDLR